MLQNLVLARLVTIVSMWAILVIGGAPAVLSATQKKPALPAIPSMKVVVVRSSEPGCEPLCPEWIAASGAITQKSPQLFRAALKLAGNRQLPVVIDSNGGAVLAAIEIGKMIRKRKLTVIVGRVIYSGCSPDKENCAPAKAASGRYAGMPLVFPGYCMSACSYILAGGTLRMSFGNDVGIHQIVNTPSYDRVRYWETYRMVNGKKKVISRKILSRKHVVLAATTKISKANERQLRNYYKTMGISGSFFDLSQRTKPESIYFMTTGELNDTRIVNLGMPKGMIFAKSLCEGAIPALNCVKH